MTETISNPELVSPSRLKKLIKFSGWTVLFLSTLVAFTIMKLPEERLHQFVLGQISTSLRPYGVTFSAKEGDLSFGFGIQYRLRGITLKLRSSQTPIKIDEITVSPALLPMFIGRMGGNLNIQHGDSSLDLSVGIRGNTLSVIYEAHEIEIEKLAVLFSPIPVKLSGTLSGSGNIDGDLANPRSLSGAVEYRFSNLGIKKQSIYGFDIPSLSISQGKIDIEIQEGKAEINTFRLGNPPSGKNGDDISVNLSGEILIGRQWESSTLNLKVLFSFSKKIMKAFVLLETILGQAKQADGSYAYKISGRIISPVPSPIRK